MDGESCDRTVEIASSFPQCTVHSSRDRGLYDAMNRGAFFARGEWLVFLQADDWLPDGALVAWRAAIEANPNAEIITGSAEAVRMVGEGGVERVWRKTDAHLKELIIENLALGEPMINARTIRKSIFKKVGPFDLAYSLASDRDFLLKLAMSKPHDVVIDAMTYRYRWHDGSRTMNAGNSLSRRLTAENLAIAEKYLLSCSAPTARDVLKLWHQAQSTQYTLCAIESFDPIAALRCFLRATRIQPLWPFAFSMEFLLCLKNWIGQGFKTCSQLRSK
jgi:glycosyltransferase involved in cell wall biosynthesis